MFSHVHVVAWFQQARRSLFLPLVVAGHSTVFSIAAAQDCRPEPERDLAARLLAALPVEIRAEREAAVEATLASCPGAIEVFLSSLVSGDFLMDSHADPANWAGSMPGAVVQTYNNRSWGFVTSAGTTVGFLGESYSTGGMLYTSPLLLDLDGDGAPAVPGGEWEPHSGMSFANPFAAFDIDGDSFAEITEWLGPGDALLVAPDPPSKIVPGPGGPRWTGPIGIRDLLGTGEGFADGFEKLGHRFDTDTNRRIEGAELDGLYLWRDLDGDAYPDDGELSEPAALSVTALVLPLPQTCTGSFVRSGVTRSLWDWWPSYLDAKKISAAALPPTSLPLGAAALPDLSSIRPPLVVGLEGLVPAAALAAAGIDLRSARLVGLSPNAMWCVLLDAASEFEELDAGRRARLWILGDLGGSALTVRLVPVPAVSVLQTVFVDDSTALLVCDEGSRLVRLDLATGSLAEMLSPHASAPGFRCSNYALRAEGRVYLSGSFHDANRYAGSEHVVRVETTGLPSLSAVANLEGLRSQAGSFGPVVGEHPVSPGLVYYAVQSGGGGADASVDLVRCLDGSWDVLDDAVSPAGMAASGDRILYFGEIAGSSDVEARVYDVVDGTLAELGVGPYSYAYLAANGWRALVTSFDWELARMTLWSSAVGSGAGFAPVLTCGIGAVRVSEDGRAIACLAPEGLYVRVLGPVDVGPFGEPWKLRLRPSHPNPFADRTTLQFELAAPARVRVEVYRSDGQRVASLLDASCGAGPHRIGWDGRDDRGRSVPAGIYLYRVLAGGEQWAGKVIRVE